MKNIQSLLSNGKLISLISTTIAILILIIFPSLTGSINNSVTSTFRTVGGSSSADTNIVIVGIDDNDIRRLGGWPIKRSYYAILLNYLSRYQPDKIGLEVFLSRRVSSLDIYDQLLLNEISKTKNVILASQLETISSSDIIFKSDSISYPSLRYVNDNVSTAHINYLTDDGIVIPLNVSVNHDTERAFAASLTNNQDASSNSEITINFSHSWESYKSFGLVEFLQLAESNDLLLHSLRGKTVLIGVVDPSIARNLSSYFDDQLPGVGLHAIATDNLNSGSFLNNNFRIASVFFFVLIVLGMCLIKFTGNIVVDNLILLTALYALSLVLFTLFKLQLNYAFFFLPLSFMIFAYIYNQFLAKDKLLSESIDEKAILQKALHSKESILAQLEKELDVSDSDSSVLEKINKLKSEIGDLKNAQRDEEVEEEGAINIEVKNFFGIIYQSSAMQKVVKMIEKVASQSATVLVLGESGSGKELVANAIHQLSIRKAEPFIAINCAALTETLLESELFGHVKGAFTNAVADKKGMFEAADKGTIFLDEIGETNETFQVKLLRVLQSGEVQKVGATNTIYVDTRIVAATNKNLKELVAEKKFREDLYYRLNVITIDLPPLRERKEDIPVLAAFFAKKEDSRLRISRAVMDQLEKIEWKGNVRELESVIKRAAIFAKTENRTIIKIGDLPESLTKIDKSNLESLILSSMREKQFSHTSINETGKELGGLSRIIVSENVRGIFFKHYFMNEFDFNKGVISMVGFNDDISISKMTTKGNTYINNISKDLEKLDTSEFEAIKIKFNSKYKNLPQKYHHYLDETIKHLLAD